jgi:hypothetical protein
MTDWTTFRDEAPDLADLAERRLAATGLMLLATIRGDGFPRISPLEPIVHDGALHLGMMPDSTKALDLRREPRCALHSATADKDLTEGDVKMWGRAREVTDVVALRAYAQELEAQLGHHFEPEAINLFVVDLEGVSSVEIVDDAMHVSTWRPGQDVRVAVKH